MSETHPRHYCGVFGVYGHPNAAELTYYGLYALQHRGQESAGIVTCADGQFRVHKGMGLVSQVFKGKTLERLKGSMAVGHTRYSTTGSSHHRNSQPLTVDCSKGQIAIAHNGNLTNAAQLREELELGGSIFQTTVDSEIILHLMARPSNGSDNNLVKSLQRIQGAYSLAIMTENELIGVRVNMGRELAKETAVDADLVVPVPDSGNCAALGYALESGLPYEMAFVRNHYVGRSFLQPSQLIRDFNVRVKLNLINELVEGKRVIIVDDSIVRGTTSKARVNNLKEAGAKEVHMRVSCPPHMNPCFYGIDFPDRKKLMAANHSIEEICDYLNADSVSYLSQEGMVKATGLPRENFCMACYDGDYPVPFDPALDKHIIEQRRARVESIGEALAKDELQPRLL